MIEFSAEETLSLPQMGFMCERNSHLLKHWVAGKCGHGEGRVMAQRNCLKESSLKLETMACYMGRQLARGKNNK